MKILVTGGMGYLGARIAQSLKDDGHDVIILSKNNDRHSDSLVAEWLKQFSLFTADVADPGSVRDAFAQARPEMVVHLAAVNEHVCAKDHRLAFEVNVLGTKNVLDASHVAGVSRFIYFSTFHVYGVQEAHAPITELTLPVPAHPYGITHLAAEHYCRASPVECAIIRFSNGVGAPKIPTIDRWSLLMLDLCKQAQESKSLTLTSPGYQMRDFVAIEDACQAIKLLLSTPSSNLVDPVFNVGSGTSTSVRSLAQTIQTTYESLYGEKIPLHAPEGKPNGADLHFSIEKIKKIGFQPSTDLEREARETLLFCEVFR